MHYRNRTAAGHYKKSAEDYGENDRGAIVAYMRAKVFAKPQDVWFSSIRAFLDIDLSKEPLERKEEIERRAYMFDAQWVFKNMQGFFLALCTVQDDADGLVLTENAYSVFQGPIECGIWTDYQVIAPVTPKIMIVMRSAILPGSSGQDEKDRKVLLLEASISRYSSPGTVTLFLEDLPIVAARNSYSHMANGELVHLPTKDFQGEAYLLLSTLPSAE